MKTTNSRTADKFVVRLPEGMREQVADVARKNHRSMNSEIIDRLEQSLLNAQFEPTQQLLDGAINTEELKAELSRAYRVIDRLLQNAVPTQDDIQEVLHLFRQQAPLAQHHAAAVGA
ncbi:Arc family DNA-binding protein [Pseudomonas sp. SC11]|uniref:Arc family DNA-binding protein n=1 Tax=Pseudomonas sp. SC11 TaxID=326927 RepID=UPI00399C43D8